jgi:hypothetical protein
MNPEQRVWRGPCLRDLWMCLWKEKAPAFTEALALEPQARTPGRPVLVAHVTHAAAVSARHCWSFLLFRQLRNEGFGGQHQ